MQLRKTNFKNPVYTYFVSIFLWLLEVSLHICAFLRYNTFCFPLSKCYYPSQPSLKPGHHYYGLYGPCTGVQKIFERNTSIIHFLPQNYLPLGWGVMTHDGRRRTPTHINRSPEWLRWPNTAKHWLARLENIHCLWFSSVTVKIFNVTVQWVETDLLRTSSKK